MSFKGKYQYGLGRRKSSTALARLYKGGGQIIVNEKPASEYFAGSEHLLWNLNRPLALLEKEKEFDISLKVQGGGQNGQIEACRLAISNALADSSDDLRTSLKKEGFLKRDSREKERKKYGLKRARKKEQFSKR